MNDTNGAPGAVSLDPPLLTWWPLLLTGLAALRAAEVGDGFDCPRCGGGIPSDAARGQYSGALSRADNATEICSRCGTDEAISHFYGWPWSRDLWLHPPGCAGECHGNQDIHTPEEDVARIQAALGAIIAPLIGARTAKERERTAKERERAGLLLDWYFELGDELHEGSER